MAKINYSDYIKKLPKCVLVAEAIFSELYNDSKLVKLSKVCSTTSGGTPLRSRFEFYNGKIPWLKSGELNDNKIKSSDEFITELGLKNSSAKLHPKGTLLLAMYGATAGKTGILELDAATNQAICALFPNEDLLRKKFLYWFLRQHRYKFIEISKGGAQPNISQKVINDTLIPLPSIQLQKIIVDVLDKIEKDNLLHLEDIPLNFHNKIINVFESRDIVEKLSTELTHQLSLISQLRQAFLREAMQGTLVSNETSDGKTGADLLEEIKKEKEQLIKDKKIKKGKPLPPISEGEIPFDIPENWVWCRLGEITINCDAARKPISSKERSNLQKVYDYYGASGVIDKIHDFTHEGTFLLIGEDGNNLISRSTPLAFIAKGKFWVNNHAHVLKYTDDTLLHFMKNWLNIFDIRTYLSGGFQPKFSQANMNLVKVPLPPLEIQNRMVAKLDELMQYCDALEASVKESQNYNAQLLQQVLREALEGNIHQKLEN